ncbi:hypothetical protein D3C84_1190640 [compost metagenome]
MCGPVDDRATHSITSKVSEKLATFVRRDAHAQGVELDEARCVGLVVGAAIFFESRNVGVEQRLV